MKNINEFLLNLKYAFRFNKPLLTARLTSALIKSSVFKKPPLRYVDFSIDFACNLKCKHCFATVLRDPRRKKMSTDDYHKVAKDCMKLGTVNFSFQGGEPIMMKNLPDIIRSCQPNKNLISVTTNGTLINEKKILELKSCGVDILTVSLDSSIAKEHDEFRRETGAFDKAINAIKLAKQHGINVTIGTVVTNQTLYSKGLTGLIDLAKDLQLLLYLILPVPAGEWINETDMLLSEKDLEYLYSLTSSSKFIRTDFQANLGEYGCGAVKEILYLTPYGDVFACPFMHISLGNIFEESIFAIRERALKIPYFKKYEQRCLVSSHKEFINKHLSKTFNKEQLPISFGEAFGYEIRNAKDNK
ncbi:MAG: hypothetical protein A2Y03_04485 [Omnitrophica WOR_2 bacterium GWF2_38_59]|nr:MAG: hypothetical protein A2Y03_04485 [Omnitrophica WOR_2 bacterium GWF2_38_59]OGX53523.1 MAG: hypothetical protein A2267_09350 [Omnitrophica WOR_2 bacterium RIFOXYA12_FULL_38_10]OGX55927.1 MAG: hypothetical protein A2447_04975 [Omnitrophica WOR_2 bacterium RIFOXYC2_FULL_38_12]OGX60353.1 MAG: hypothetical protein A2306_06400 [Omnitrophica WOR_2 bacterium RIFOXYB2_FULL_38_16]HBG60285.1 hypothetical protein [Candidatus Omnitrophota bacterium]